MTEHLTVSLLCISAYQTFIFVYLLAGVNGYGGGPPTGPGGIPDPYAQPGYAPYGAPPANGYGGYGTGYY